MRLKRHKRSGKLTKRGTERDSGFTDEPVTAVLSADQWKKTDQSVERETLTGIGIYDDFCYLILEIRDESRGFLPGVCPGCVMDRLPPHGG